jgi:NADH:ubiquinone oxidoreductase subunit 2 (subunit N)
MFPSTIPVIAYIYVFIKLFICVFPDFFLFYSTIFYFFAILSMLSGVLGALIQKKLKRLIAYSPVSTIGYIIAGIFGDTVSSVQYCLFHLFVYIFNIIPIFIILLNYRVNDTNRVDHIRSFSNICYQNK